MFFPQGAVTSRSNSDEAKRALQLNAHLLLLGVSRTGKTPLSIFLGQRGYKVANLPLVPGVPLAASAPIEFVQKLETAAK